ncbi:MULTISPECIES: adenosine deaminase [Mesorhizobium]|uniref:adenosine deaminase n=1 Tax=Mesorhizobium TaxID=68287 RepID=UPI0010A97100|nr:MULTISPECIES: adenosine deaminase [Mesorhizobium]
MNLDFKSLPKAETHVHLEGCFDVSTIVELARENSLQLPRPETDLLKFSGLAEFLDFLDFICGLSRTKDQLAKAAYAFSKRLKDSGIGYADLIVNPTHWKLWRNDLASFIDGLDAGFRAAEQEGMPPVGLCISLLRQQTGEEALELVDMLTQFRHPRVVALSIDGNEMTAGRTGPRFADAFRRAGLAGFKKTVHAGESSGPEGIRDAIFLLEADRIDHGVRAVEDSDLIKVLRDRQVPLGICPTSNIVLGLYKSLEEHPIDTLRKAGVPVSVNTDDPALLQIGLVDEFERCATTFGWDKATCCAVAETSIRASFANQDVKTQLLGDLQGWMSEGFARV